MLFVVYRTLLKIVFSLGVLKYVVCLCRGCDGCCVVCLNCVACMFMVSKALLISSATVIVRAGGAIWLNPFTTVLFNECSSVTVDCFVPVLRGCVWYVCCYVRKKALLQCLQLLRGGIWACMRYYISQLPYVWYYVGVKSSFQTCSGGMRVQEGHFF